ncbi:MAG TPA: diacylglycerol kinase family protein [Actinomycetota bacterium]|jgi:diacylglycerol kinase (ATP)|nr:diacylglycerol kinase family protein [Actinomycetota bacterium]
MRALLVCNPAAGGGQPRRLLPAVLERLRAAGVEVETYRTASLDDARQAARGAAPDYTAVVAMGGDGTVGACAAGIGEAGTAGRAALGLIPAGGGNDVARNLGLPFDDPLAAATLLPTLTWRRADLVRAGERLFLNAAGAGFDSEVSRLANHRLAKAPARLRYVGAMLAELALWRPAGFRITLDGRQLEARGWLVAIGNGQSYGGGMRIAPDARLDDGLLDVVLIGELSKPSFLAVFPKVYSGRHISHPAVTVWRAARVGLDADRPLAVHLEGELAGTVPVAFEILPGAIRLLAADGAPALSPR